MYLLGSKLRALCGPVGAPGSGSLQTHRLRASDCVVPDNMELLVKQQLQSFHVYPSWFAANRNSKNKPETIPLNVAHHPEKYTEVCRC